MSADPRREYEEAYLSGQRGVRKQNFDPAITVHEFTLESMGRKITELEKLNAELLTACKALQMEARARNCGLRIADEAITKAERSNYYPRSMKIRTEIKRKLPCCGYKVKERDTGPVFWNIYASCVQCHNCGTIYHPEKEDPTSPEERGNVP